MENNELRLRKFENSTLAPAEKSFEAVEKIWYLVDMFP